jgi:hypothetical protein
MQLKLPVGHRLSTAQERPLFRVFGTITNTMETIPLALYCWRPESQVFAIPGTRLKSCWRGKSGLRPDSCWVPASCRRCSRTRVVCRGRNDTGGRAGNSDNHPSANLSSRRSDRIFGKRQVGRLALIDGDPSKDIIDLQQVELVMRDGKLMKASELRSAIGISGPPKRAH